MSNITVRNIPEKIINKIRTLSSKERRSLNNQILVVLEAGLEKELEYHNRGESNINKETQLSIWEKLCGRWDDDRTASEIIADIVKHRSEGRSVRI